MQTTCFLLIREEDAESDVTFELGSVIRDSGVVNTVIGESDAYLGSLIMKIGFAQLSHTRLGDMRGGSAGKSYDIFILQIAAASVLHSGSEQLHFGEFFPLPKPLPSFLFPNPFRFIFLSLFHFISSAVLAPLPSSQPSSISISIVHLRLHLYRPSLSPPSISISIHLRVHRPSPSLLSISIVHLRHPSPSSISIFFFPLRFSATVSSVSDLPAIFIFIFPSCHLQSSPVSGFPSPSYLQLFTAIDFQPSA
ncbi:hypothetical protein ACLOJK_006831 [Asimina triloba]